jgi:uncharacterized protein (TIGR02246 family)
MHITRLFQAVAAACASLFLIGGAFAAEAGPAEDIAALKAFGDKWIALYTAGDVEGLQALYEPDAWLMPKGRSAKKGLDEIVAFFEMRTGGGALDMRFDYEDVRIEGDMGYLISKWWLDFTPNGADQPIRDAGRSFVVFRKGGDGQWRVWRDMDNLTPDVPVPGAD